MRRFLRGMAIVLVLGGVQAAARAGIVSTDGYLTDWGVSPSSSDQNALTFSGGIQNPAQVGSGIHGAIQNFWGSQTMYYHAEDVVGRNGQVGPDYGGQNYDAEFMGVVVHDGNLHIAISSGQRPDNGFAYFAPGDLRIETRSGNVYGIEVGGGAGNTSRTDGSLGGTAQGTTFALNSGGYTVGSTPLGSQLAGSVWLTTDKGIPSSGGTFSGNWYYDPIRPYQPTQFQSDVGDSPATQVGTADYVFNYDSSLRQHAFIELSVSAALFGDLNGATIAWRPSCGNDELTIDGGLLTVQIGVVPEPASLAIWSLVVGVSVAGMRSRRRKKPK